MNMEAKKSRWAGDSKSVRRALKWIKSNKPTSEELVKWDGAHGQNLFTWHEGEAAHIGRCHEATKFMNRFRAKFEGMRVRGFIHIDEDADKDINKTGYYPVEEIAEHEGMRAQVVADITKRMANLASELKMWKLSNKEQEELFAKLRALVEP